MHTARSCSARARRPTDRLGAAVSGESSWWRSQVSGLLAAAAAAGRWRRTPVSPKACSPLSSRQILIIPTHPGVRSGRPRRRYDPCPWRTTPQPRVEETAVAIQVTFTRSNAARPQYGGCVVRVPRSGQPEHRFSFQRICDRPAVSAATIALLLVQDTREAPTHTPSCGGSSPPRATRQPASARSRLAREGTAFLMVVRSRESSPPGRTDEEPPTRPARASCGLTRRSLSPGLGAAHCGRCAAAAASDRDSPPPPRRRGAADACTARTSATRGRAYDDHRGPGRRSSFGR